MKVAVVQQAVPTSTGTQDYTDAQFASDVKCAIFLTSKATAANTSTADSVIGMGFTDLGADAWVGMGGADGVATGDLNGQLSGSVCAGRLTGNSGTIQISGTTSGQSHPATGVRVNWTAVDTAMLCTAVLIGGSDVSADLVTGTFTNATAPESVVVNHGLGVTPTHILCITAASSAGATRNRLSIGAYIVAANTYVVHATDTSGTTSISPGSHIDTDCVAAEAGLSSVAYKVTLSSVGASSFTMTATGGATTDVMYFLVLRVLNSVSATAVVDIPTSGTATLASGLAVQPKLVLVFPSRRTASGYLAGSDEAGAFGVGVAVSGGNYCVTSSSDRQGTTTTTVEKCQTSNTESIRILDAAGAVDVQSAITLTSGGATATPSNYPASAFKMGVFVLGATGVTAGGMTSTIPLKSLVGGALAH